MASRTLAPKNTQKMPIFTWPDMDLIADVMRSSGPASSGSSAPKLGSGGASTASAYLPYFDKPAARDIRHMTDAGRARRRGGGQLIEHPHEPAPLTATPPALDHRSLCGPVLVANRETAVPASSQATQAAYWLLRFRLDPQICDDVSVRLLAAQIRGSHLID